MPKQQLQKKTLKKTHKKAFSLLELSVVIIIIGILLSGVIAGKRLIADSKLQLSQALTKSSSIYSIPDLKLWLETSLNNSIVGAVNGADISNNKEISAWNDISGNAINVSQATTTNQPKYLLKGINDLPTINFDGNDDYLSTTNAPLSPGDDNFTFVVVWKRISDNSNSSPGILLDQNNNGSSTAGKRAGIRTKSIDGKYGFEGGESVTIDNNFFNVDYTYGLPVISVITLDISGTIKVYTNSHITAISGSIGIGDQDIANNIFVVGARGTATKNHFFPGYISEIMVFDRDLSPTEITKIVNYLSKKYNITIS